MINLGRHPILGITVDAVDYAYATDRIVDAARVRHPLAVTALAVHGVMTGVLDDVHQRRLNGLDLVVPDGQPVRWALRLLRSVRLKDRVYGPELTLRVLRAAASSQIPVFFYGSTAATLYRFVANMTKRFPTLHVAGAEASRFRKLSPAEKAGVVERIQASGAGIVFVGLGCPRQEVWAFEYRELLSIPILAVGAAFDFHAGTLAQAPAWMQAHGFEWLFRWIQEPTRLWKRYLLLNPLYLAAIVGEASGTWRPVVRNPDGDEPEESYG